MSEENNEHHHEKHHETSHHEKHHDHGKKINYWKISTLVLAVLLIIAVGMLIFQKCPTTGNSTVTGTVSKDIQELNTKLAGNGVTMGLVSAPVTMVVFSEFECPFCQRYESTLASVIKDYVNTGKVKLVFRHFPLTSIHPNAVGASLASLCANEQGKFWELHDILFENNDQLSDANYKKWAKELGLDETQFNNCLDSKKYNDVIQKDLLDGQANGVNGVPASFINGKSLVGAQDYATVKKTIEEALSGKVTPDTTTTPTQPVVDTSKDPVVKMTVITDKTCKTCDTSRVIDVTKEQIFPTVVVTELDYSDSDVKKMVEDLKVNSLPIYLFDKSIENAANYDQVAPALEKKGDLYMITPAAVGVGKFLVPPQIGSSPVKGSADAKLTIFEFSEFECPFCAKFINEAYPDIVKNYVDTGKVKIVFKQFPLSFHQNAHAASQASLCANDQGKFWEMHDKLFANQNALDMVSLKKYAKDLGLDSTKFDSCMDTQKFKAQVDAEQEEGVKFGVSGTPAFIIGDSVISGAMPYDVFKQAIDDALASQ